MEIPTNEMSKCIICDETMNKKTRLVIACPYCEYEACRTCCETYILSQNTAKCMNSACGKEWTRKFMVDKLKKNFITGPWKKHREKILFDKEIALLPETQVVVETEIHKEKTLEKIAECEKLIAELNVQRKNLIVESKTGINTTYPAERKLFIRNCPVDNCRGFLSTQWKCGICETYTCSQCHVVKSKTDEHVCNADDVSTAALLKKDTKPCPSCHTGIFKIEGCDQMWCTQCHTAFSWKTGKLEDKIHNPHYFEWQRLNGGVPRAQGDIQCGREIDYNFHTNISILLRGKTSMIIREPIIRTNNTEKIDKILNCVDKVKIVKELSLKQTEILNILSYTFRSLEHLRVVQMPTFLVDQLQKNMTLRVGYMRNKIDKETFQSRIERDNKKYEKNREIHEVLQMFVHTITDIMYRVRDAISRIPIINTVERIKPTIFDETQKNMTEIPAIVCYVNTCLLEIATTYNSKPKKIHLYDIGPSLHYIDVLVNA